MGFLDQYRERKPTVGEVWRAARAAELDAKRAMHARFACPGWQYTTTEGQRTDLNRWSSRDTPPGGGGWERNTDAGDGGRESIHYTERSFWRRRANA